MANCDGVLHFGEVQVVDAGVFIVVDASCCQHCCALQFVNVGQLEEAAFSKKLIEGLAQISAVGLVVVGDVFVAVLDLDGELHESLEVELYLGEAVAFGEEPGEQTEHFVSVGEFAQLENVEFVKVCEVEHVDGGFV